MKAMAILHNLLVKHRINDAWRRDDDIELVDEEGYDYDFADYDEDDNETRRRQIHDYLDNLLN